MHDHLAMRDQLDGSEKHLAGKVLAQETADPCPQGGNDVFGLLRRRENDRLHTRIRAYDLAYERIRGATPFSTPVNHTQAFRAVVGKHAVNSA